MSFYFSEKPLFCRIQYGYLCTFGDKLILYDYESIPLVSNTRWAYVRPRLLASNSSLYTTDNGAKFGNVGDNCLGRSRLFPLVGFQIV